MIPRRRRPEHAPKGDPCERCGSAAAFHRPERTPRPDARRRPDAPGRKRPRNADRIIGIDGEGRGRRPHLYTFLAASDADGNKWSVADPAGLSTVACLDLILSLPRRALVAGFAFNYDLTKILRDVPSRHLWRLFHEESRAFQIGGRTVYSPVKWQGYRLNYVNRRFTVRRGKLSTTVWDFFRFFSCSFVRALTDWKIATPAELARMSTMKSRRATFDRESESDVQAYCLEECRYLARLGRALLDAHESAGLKLATYNGPGSTASVLLTLLGIGERRGVQPDEMRRAVAGGFFGGRFEISRMGPVPGPVFAYDLASAYPYAATLLPCLVHGSWEHVYRPTLTDIHRATLALVHWTDGATRGAWGGLPMRSPKGSIVFPLSGDGGYAWRDEYLAALNLGAQYAATDAWIYSARCQCPPPFAALPTYYRERCRLGKDGAGRVLKSATNSVYGKLAQSRGLAPPFQSWVAAGNITSFTRAALLGAIGAAPSPSDVLMVATDGVYSRVPLALPPPRDTGTGDLEKPLGSWDAKTVDGGIFLVRPGIYFPLDPAATGETRARGVGQRTLSEHTAEIVAAYEAGAGSVALGGMTRFVGAKSALHRHNDGSVNRSADFGEWVDHEIVLQFTPAPKRRTRLPDGRLTPWARARWLSCPYDPAAAPSPEAIALGAAAEVLAEQPDGDFTEGD